jgi:rhodanese-related sulfurtransferase
LHPHELQNWYRGGQSFLLLDVREREEFGRHHLPGAVNLPLSSLNNTMPAIDGTNPIVVYCAKGSRSAKAAAILLLRQPEWQIFDLAGGFENWLKQEARL